MQDHAATEAGRLLRVLLVRFGQMPAGSGPTVLLGPIFIATY